jgi:hypothetical protein
MNICIFNQYLSDAAARHADVRVVLATQRFRERVSWVKVCLKKTGAASAACRMLAGVRGVGVVTGAHEGPDPVACVEIAAERLKQAALRRLKARWQVPRRWFTRPRAAARRTGAAGDARPDRRRSRVRAESAYRQPGATVPARNPAW